MPRWIGILVIASMIGIPLLILWNDSRFNSITYNCDGKRDFTLSTNTPGNTHWAEARMEGSVIGGTVAVTGFPNHEPGAPQLAQNYTAGSSVFETYAGDRYGPAEMTFDPAPGAECDLHITYRMKSDLSMVNPLW